MTSTPTSHPWSHDDINDLIAEFIREWITRLDKLAQALFFDPEFKRSLHANAVEDFLRDEPKILERAYKKAGLPVFIMPPPPYPVLHALFEPIFALLMKEPNVLWGGINYWDTVSNSFFTQQFTREGMSAEELKIFNHAMGWMLQKESNEYLLWLTTFMFKVCDPPGMAGVFVRDRDYNPHDDPARLSFYDFVARVHLPEQKERGSVRRQLVTADEDNEVLAKILKDYFRGPRPVVDFTTLPSPGGPRMKFPFKTNEQYRFENLFKFFDLITPAPTWRRLYYVSARLKPDAQVAGLLLAAKGDVDQTLMTFAQFFVSRVSSFVEYVISSYEIQRQAIRSAIAAIMGRNMSHNVGSHVLARISTPQTVSDAFFSENFLDKVKPFLRAAAPPAPPRPGAAGSGEGFDPFGEGGPPDVESPVGTLEVQSAVELATTRAAQLNAFLRMRMDFVADIATALKPPSPMRISFVGEVLLPFAGQWLLWENLCGSQNMTQGDISFRVTMAGASTRIRAGGQEYPEGLDANLASVAVGVPNGALGCQAFYSIVENFVRNSAKHSNDGARKRIEITFAFETEPKPGCENFFKVTISDDWGACKNDPGLVGRLGELLKQQLIKEDGSLISSNRGLKEMKAAASYLRGLLPDSVEDHTLEPPLLRAVEVEGGSLGYEFYLLKPKELLVVDCGGPAVNERTRDLLGAQGVQIVESVRDAAERATAYSMLFVLNAGKKSDERFIDRFIHENVADMPVRVFFQNQNKQQIKVLYGSWSKTVNIGSARELYNHFLVSLRQGQGLAASTDLRELWMRMVCGEPETELWVDGDADTPQWNIEGLSRLVTKEDRPQPGTQVILYSRHGFRNRENNVAFYEPYSGGGVDPIYFIFDNPPQTAEGVRALACQLIEAGALPVYILDERVQEAASVVRRGFSSDLTAGEPRDMIYWLEQMRVYVPSKEHLDLENAPDCQQIETWLEATTRKCTVGCQIAPLVVIHQGILDGLGLADGEDAQRWFNRIKGKLKLSDFVITSGRGIPDNIPPQSRFVPLSTVALYTVERKSKFHLVKALMAARRASGRGTR